MHRKLRSPWTVLGGALLALFQAALPGHALAQVCTPQTRPIVVTLAGTTRLQMTSKKAIRTVTNPKEGVVAIRTVERDPTVILLVGQQPGITRLELEDADGVKEVFEIHVQADIEYLSSQLRRAVPLANIQVIPNGVNSVILTGFVTRVEDVRAAEAIAGPTGLGFTVVNMLRTSGVQQVQLDVVVARVDRSKGRNFGFNFLQNSRNEIFGSTIGNVIPAPGTIGAGGTLSPTSIAGQTLSSATGQANLFGGILMPNSGFLPFLEALENEGLAKLLVQPRLVTLSGNPASLLDGGEQAVPIPAGLGQVGVQFEEFGTRLNFLPIVMGTGKIHLEVEPEVSTLTSNGAVSIAGASVLGRATQRVHTTVEIESGQTLVIGGLIQHTTTGSTTKVPVLGQLPFIGTLFSTKTYAEDEFELVIVVTPYLVDPQSCDQFVKCLPGQETRSPDDFELFLEGILEAPRGPREVFQGNRYVPVHHNGPTANLFPCAGRTALGAGPGLGGASGCGPAGCAAPVQSLPPAVSGVRRLPGPTAPPALPVVIPGGRTPLPAPLPAPLSGTGEASGSPLAPPPLNLPPPPGALGGPIGLAPPPLQPVGPVGAASAEAPASPAATGPALPPGSGPGIENE